MPLLGSGAMGEVYLAEDTRIARQVAVKVLKNEINIYPIFDFGEQTIDKTTFTYMVMPFRPEGSLVDWLQLRKTTAFLSPQEVIQL